MASTLIQNLDHSSLLYSLVCGLPLSQRENNLLPSTLHLLNCLIPVYIRPSVSADLKGESFSYTLLANLFFFQPLAFLKYQGLQFLSISRVIDVIARFLVQSLSAGTEVSVFPLLSCYFSVSFLSSKIMLSSLVLVGLCHTYVFCKYSS